MDETTAEKFRASITARLAELGSADDLGAAGQATVTLDQQSVGRLSRMDALQNQAMAKASHARRTAERKRLMTALTRIDEGEFGYCEDCGDDIALPRLDLDPAATRCIDCARG
ncbi:TraR/DksA family transcriptional regulator [Pseudohalocynthiibacter aestuariivivens]|uniref:TraR/DksA C4-type zinc finger protein n=1 Tax=Roseovarius pelagicus TaxID=2980108 RepID=A0ABY6D668_9RHOB|nr:MULTISPECIES: TraR/DksA C4-type zinc finger protein [Rhodobacterales]QIE46376.1 TraR/DksA family transcriptional regulator [Pseudohalocynthiibacter aestuariivivens]UXX81646.1 TraR/DksA C4-type zinc finger protein [Roseovarius pelagicus]